ncbi:MAG TPA: hypothetical protein VMW55_08835 [Nitrosopumilaceae archaeon]|jgi:hypothetical protein|nr:hypothetical protein [Nitrosopumilaceae archaeon]
MKKYLIDSKMFELDKHYRECQKQNLPFIKARKNPIDNNYVVKVDLITCKYNFTPEDEKNINLLFEKETNSQKIHNPKNLIFKGCNIDKELVWYDGILEERLDTFCQNLFNLSDKSKA